MHTSAAQALPSAKPVDDTVAGEHLAYYWRATWIPLIVLVAGEILLHYLYPSAVAARILEVLVFAGTGWMMLGRGKMGSTAAYAGAHIGIIGGILFTLFELLVDAQLWRIFNLIARPMWMGILGFIVSGLVVRVIQRVGTRGMTNYRNMEGGEHHG